MSAVPMGRSRSSAAGVQATLRTGSESRVALAPT
jgi:hypothetical protein